MVQYKHACFRGSLNGRSDDEFLTLPKSKTENPLFEQGWMMTSNDPWQDKLQVEVVDVKVGLNVDYKMQINALISSSNYTVILLKAQKRTLVSLKNENFTVK